MIGAPHVIDGIIYKKHGFFLRKDEIEENLKKMNEHDEKRLNNPNFKIS